MGKVEKGPMIRGSHVDMRTLDEYMTPTGSFYSTTIDNNLGDFNYGALKINSPYAQLTADGYFFNEIDGELSEGTIKLDAIVDLKDNSTINVNVLTHLKSKRIHHL
ncbi:MAG TPA: RagB/SusD family nutrient uptake outer membrane protein, partial [Parabacteroides merdae]|nr:RagB/SusD family nutrient uptake outer membrane protein [Parabacteroides merdae]